MTYYHRRLSSFPLIMQKLLVCQPNEKKGKKKSPNVLVWIETNIFFCFFVLMLKLLRFSPVTGSL